MPILNPNRNLRIGVFLSGQLREVEYLPIIVEILKAELPTATVIGACWKECAVTHGKQAERLGIPMHYLDPPVMNYAPYASNTHIYEKHKQWLKKVLGLKKDDPVDQDARDVNQTKQILVHNEMVKRYRDDFDVMIRLRWDHALGKDLQLYDLVEEAYRLPSIVSLAERSTFPVGLTSRMKTHDSQDPFKTSMPHIKTNTNEERYVLTEKNVVPMVIDYGLIIHRTVDWNTDLIDDLHEKKLLLPAEYGWYQSLVELPNNRYIHWDGGCSIFRMRRGLWKRIHNVKPI